jgi:hypothetical protein
MFQKLVLFPSSDEQLMREKLLFVVPILNRSLRVTVEGLNTAGSFLYGNRTIFKNIVVLIIQTLEKVQNSISNNVYNPVSSRSFKLNLF